MAAGLSRSSRSSESVPPQRRIHLMTGTPRRRMRKRFATALLVVGAAVLVLAIGLPSAGADTPPYSLPVALPSAAVASPAFDAAAPYTPAVLSLVAQLEPSATPT